jgi:cysteine-rich repeat protein
MARTPLVLASLLAALAPLTSRAVDVQGTVSLQGQVAFSTPIPGIELDAVRLEVDPATEATGNGVRCSVVAATGDTANAAGAYPDTGVVSVELSMERGGPQQPEGACIVTLRASGFDGAATTAHGSTTLLVDTASIMAGATLVPGDITLRASKALAGLATDCKKWAKKQLKLRDKCNARILKSGGAVALEKCKDAGPAPMGCDPGGHVAAVLALAHGANDQQTDVASGQAVDLEALSDQAKCQKLFGKAAVRFTTVLAGRIQSECVKPGDDSETCRDQQANAAKAKLDPIDDCNAAVAVDGATGRSVPLVGEPCASCIGPQGTIDEKCLKACFESSLRELAGGLVGDVPVCGDGIPQNGEFCDDGNTDDGDCCTSLCGVNVPDPNQQSCGVGACEASVAMCLEGELLACEPGTPGEESFPAATCGNGVDDDCDGSTDAADLDCLP